MIHPDNPCVTICIPIFNAERFLDMAIQSVLNQTYKKWILFLINDGSTDSSMLIARKYESPNVIIVDDKENKGLVYRLNQSISMTETIYYARMDADDIMDTERLEKQVNILQSNPNIDVLGTNVYSIDENNKVNAVRSKISNNLQICSKFVHPSIMGKTEWFKNNKYLDVAIRMEDSELWYRTRSNSNFFVYNIPLLYYREFGGDYFKKYFKAIKSEFSLFWFYFKLKKYKFAFHWLIKSQILIVKSLIYFLFSLLNIEGVLIKKRSISLSNLDKDSANVALKNSVK